jgi:hypothetical protein
VHFELQPSAHRSVVGMLPGPRPFKSSYRFGFSVWSPCALVFHNVAAHTAGPVNDASRFIILTAVAVGLMPSHQVWKHFLKCNAPVCLSSTIKYQSRLISHND